MTSTKIRVLIVDDSALVRQTLNSIYAADSELEVIGVAADPFAAAAIMRQTIPDVISLDVEMPRMDGITFLKKIMSQYPIPVVICSALTEKMPKQPSKLWNTGLYPLSKSPKSAPNNSWKNRAFCFVTKSSPLPRPKCAPMFHP